MKEFIQIRTTVSRVLYSLPTWYFALDVLGEYAYNIPDYIKNIVQNRSYRYGLESLNNLQMYLYNYYNVIRSYAVCHLFLTTRNYAVVIFTLLRWSSSSTSCIGQSWKYFSQNSNRYIVAGSYRIRSTRKTCNIVISFGKLDQICVKLLEDNIILASTGRCRNVTIHILIIIYLYHVE